MFGCWAEIPIVSSFLSPLFLLPILLLIFFDSLHFARFLFFVLDYVGLQSAYGSGLIHKVGVVRDTVRHRGPTKGGGPFCELRF